MLMVVIIITLIGIILFKMSASTGVGNEGVADYDGKMEIWENQLGIRLN